MVYLSRIVTKGGDGGYTSLGDGQRVSKSDQRIAAIGVVDELNAYIGVVIAQYMAAKTSVGLLGPLSDIQNDLFDMGADLCMPYSDKELPGKLRLTEQQIVNLETLITEDNKSLPPLNSFVLPGGSLLSAHLHVARTVCRRVERTIVSLRSKGTLFNPAIPIYLNRLGDLLFIWSRMMNGNGERDFLWKPGKNQEEEKNEG